MALALACWAAGARADTTKVQCVGANTAGQNFRRDGKLAAAREQFRACADPACPVLVRDDCSRRLDELEGAQPTIIFEAKDGAGADLGAVKVTMDSQVLAERLEGKALLIDPGEHTFTFETSGQPAVTKMLMIQEAQKERRETIHFGAPATPLVAEPPTGERPAESAQPSPESNHGLGRQKILGIVSAALGVVGVGVGGVFGILTASAASQQKADCASPTDCLHYSEAASHHSAGVTDGAVSTVSFVAGGAFLVTGAVLFFTAKRPVEQPAASAIVVTPSLGPGGGGLLLNGAF